MAGPLKKRGGSKEHDELVAAVATDPRYREPLLGLLRKACTELERRIDRRGDREREVDVLELIGVVKTVGSILVEADALLGEEAPPK